MRLFSAESVEKVRAECIEADRLFGVTKSIFMDFPVAMIETVPRYELNDAFINFIQEIVPHEVYVPHRGDMQLDHKMVVDTAMVALRPKYKYTPQRILSYETLSETGWDIPNVTNEFIPNSYIDISDFLNKKIEAMTIFTTQIADFPNARSIESIKALAVYRGTSVNLEAAKAFTVIREIQRRNRKGLLT